LRAYYMYPNFIQEISGEKLTVCATLYCPTNAHNVKKVELLKH